MNLKLSTRVVYEELSSFPEPIKFREVTNIKFVHFKSKSSYISICGPQHCFHSTVSVNVNKPESHSL